MDEELFVEIKIKFPEGDHEKTGLFKLPYEMDALTNSDVVDFCELIKAWIITTISPED